MSFPPFNDLTAYGSFRDLCLGLNVRFLNSLRVSTRMQLLLGLTLVGLLILCVTALFHIKLAMQEDC